MDFRNREVKFAYFREAIFCIGFGTAVGLAVYGFFLYFHIAIFGWNLGLAFAPLAAGYAETIVANRIIGQDIGAISAFILFLYTTFYSFILKNPTLGVNALTVVSIAVILQAAFPTLMNYILIVGGLGIVSYFLGIFSKITGFLKRKLEYVYYKYIVKKPHEIEIRTIEEFDEKKSNEKINAMDFYFVTPTDVPVDRTKNLGQFHATVILDKDKKLVHSKQEHAEIVTLNNLKKAKDECLIKLAKNIQAAGGNGVINLKIEYGLIGLGGDNFQITTMGMGIYLS